RRAGDRHGGRRGHPRPARPAGHPAARRHARGRTHGRGRRPRLVDRRPGGVTPTSRSPSPSRWHDSAMDGAGSPPTALVYVDGFNLYRQLLEGQPQYKWLDLTALADQVLPDYRVIGVRYFTAKIKQLPGKDASAPQRQ